MLSLVRATTRTLAARRFYGTAESNSNLRVQLMDEVKAAMKRRDTRASTTLRSVLADINSESKKVNGDLSPSATASIFRKAIRRRNEAATQFVEAKRPDLAEIEQQEAELLSKFLPPLLSAADIDVHIKAALDTIPSGTDPLKVSRLLFKEFYSRVDKPLVDSNLVKERAQALLDAREQS